eukprot:8965775-Lingulodinium_polyedra.AAC.1
MRGCRRISTLWRSRSMAHGAPPYAIARQTFENIIKLAKQLENNTSGVIGYGLASKPISGATQDS